MTTSNLAIGTDAVPAKGTTTPVTWNVAAVSSSLVEFENRTSGVYLLYPRTTLGWKRPSASVARHKITFRLKVPVIRVGADGVTDTAAANILYTIDAVLPTLATNAELTEAYRIFIQTLLDGQMKDAFGGLVFPN
jgi:hypothetical protein